MEIEIEYPLNYASSGPSGDTLFRDTGHRRLIQILVCILKRHLALGPILLRPMLLKLWSATQYRAAKVLLAGHQKFKFYIV